MKKCKLFANMSDEDIDLCLKCSCSTINEYKKNEIIFNMNDEPDYMYVLMSGSIAVCKDSELGDRSIIGYFSKAGDIFGEVYIFIENVQYDFYCVVCEKSSVLKIPKKFFYTTCEKNCNYHSLLLKNTLSILANKTYDFRKKLDIVTGKTLRQKIARFLLENADDNQVVKMKMNRGDFANYLNVARPSLSRELNNMKNEQLIEILKKDIKIVSIINLEKIL